MQVFTEQRRSLVLSCLVMAMMVCANFETKAEVVTFVSDASEFHGVAIESDGSYIGDLGDLIELSPGLYRIRLTSKTSHIFAFQLQLGDIQAVKNSAVSLGYCERHRGVDWPTPNLRKSRKYDGVLEVVLKAPEPDNFVPNINCSGPPESGCSSCMSMRLPSISIELDVTSEPSGAEIWINGIIQQFTSPASLSVPFNPQGAGVMAVMLRLKGRINCIRTFVPVDGKKVSLDCRLKPLPGVAGPDGF